MSVEEGENVKFKISPFFLIVILVLGIQTVNASSFKNENLNVGIVVHPIGSPYLNRALIDQIGLIDYVQLPIEIYGNTTDKIDDAMNELKKWLNAFKGYKITLQTYHHFGYYNETRGYWMYNLTSLSETFYDNFFNKLHETVKGYDVFAYIGFNEPYLHLNENEVPELIKREHFYFKKYFNIYYVFEDSLPCTFWRERRGFFNDDIPNYDLLKEFWINYSDFVSSNLWYNEGQPICEKGRQIYLNEWTLLKVFSKEINKPIFICELPFRYGDVFKQIVKEAMAKPHYCQAYSLMEKDSTLCTLYTYNSTTGEITKNQQLYQNFVNGITETEFESINKWFLIIIPLVIFFISFKKIREML